MSSNQLLLTEAKILLKYNDSISLWFMTREEVTDLTDAFSCKNFNKIKELHDKYKSNWNKMIDDLISPLIVCM